jgi:hypothetical protein
MKPILSITSTTVQVLGEGLKYLAVDDDGLVHAVSPERYWKLQQSSNQKQ